MKNETKGDEGLDSPEDSPFMEMVFSKFELDALYKNSDFYNATYGQKLNECFRCTNESLFEFSRTLNAGFIGKSLKWNLRAERIIALAKKRMPVISALEEEAKSINDQMKKEFAKLEEEFVACIKEGSEADKAEKITALTEEKLPIIKVLEGRLKKINEQLSKCASSFSKELDSCFNVESGEKAGEDKPSGEMGKQ